MANARSKRILSITHEQDIDGLFCGAILKNAFPDTLVFLTNYGHDNIKRASDIIKFNIRRSTKTGLVVITDLAIDNDIDVKTIEEAADLSKTYGWEFVWLDHHNWEKEIKQKLEPLVTLIVAEDNIKKLKCASELVVEYFALNRTACKRMANFAHITDFRLPQIYRLPPLPEMVTYYRSLPESYHKLHSIVDKASRGIFWDEELQQEYETQYLPLKESAMSSAMKSLSMYEINGLGVAIAESPRILSKSLLSEKIFQESPATKLIILYSPDGRVSVRRRPTELGIRCDRIARTLSGGLGGGHSYAAAGIIKSNNGEPLKESRIVQELQRFQVIPN